MTNESAPVSAGGRQQAGGAGARAFRLQNAPHSYTDFTVIALLIIATGY